MHRVLAAGTIALTMALVTACSPDLTLDGRKVADDVPFLQQVEENWRNAIGDDEVSVADGSHCWLARSNESKEIGRQAFCGPIRHLAAKDDGVWDVWSFDATVAEDGTVTIKDPEAKSTGADFPTGSEPYRPDDAEFPQNAGSLAAPKAPPVPKGFAQRVDDVQIAAPKKPAAESARIVTPEVVLTVAEVGQVETVPGDHESAVRGPADGEELRALRFELAEEEESRTSDAKVAYAVQVGDVRKPVDLFEDYDGGDLSGSIVVGVPQGEDAQLIVTFAGVDQTVSLTSGERTSKTAAAYYRSKTTAELAKTYGPHRVAKGDFGFEHQTQFTGVKLLPYVDGLGWAKQGTMWVSVGAQGASSSTNIPGAKDYYYNDPVFSAPSSAQLVDAQGKTYPLAGELETVKSSEGELVFQVPETTTAVTLKYAPTATFAATRIWTSQANPTGGTVTLPVMTAQINLPQ
jgi:hypothetical protein